MSRIKIQQYFIISAALTAFLWAQSSTYSNPIGGISSIGDPFVMKTNGQYYMYCTSAADYGFKVWQSDNLVDWEEKGLAFNRYYPGNDWGRCDFWAPEVIAYDGAYFMTYSARATDGKLKICLAKSVYPIGPFINIKAPLLDDALVCIDGNFLIDDDGTPYLYYSKDCSENVINGKHISQIYVQQMTPHSLEPIGEPVLCVQPSQTWEHPQDDWQWNEGPFILKNNGIYYLMYSSNYFASPDYSIGYATSNSPLGPWSKFVGNPVLSKNLAIGVSGPGHNSVTMSPDDSELFVVYHTHTYPDNPSGDRQPNMDRMYFSNDSLIIIGPTRSPQPAPSAEGTSVIQQKKKILNEFLLNQNYPNPFNPKTRISYQLSQSANVCLAIFDTKGRLTEVLVNRRQSSGNYSETFNGELNASGIYYYKLSIDENSYIKKMVLLK